MNTQSIEEKYLFLKSSYDNHVGTLYSKRKNKKPKMKKIRLRTFSSFFDNHIEKEGVSIFVGKEIKFKYKHTIVKFPKDNNECIILQKTFESIILPSHIQDEEVAIKFKLKNSHESFYIIKKPQDWCFTWRINQKNTKQIMI